jgi:hypothetical protein
MATTGDVTVSRSGQTLPAVVSVVADAGQASTLDFRTGASRRWQFLKTADAEAGSNAGSDCALVRYADNGTYLSTPISVSRATGRSTIAALSISGDLVVGAPLRPGQYTLTSLPSAAIYNGYEIDVTNSTIAPAGRKRCVSNGTNWCLINTSTPVS